MLKLNMADVIDALRPCVPYFIALAVIAIFAIGAIIACRKMGPAKKYLIRAQAGGAIVLALAIILNLICIGPMSSLLALVSGNGSITEESAQEATKLCEDIAADGIVLEQNDGGLLPLSSGASLNVFGWASVDPVYGGTGSGALSDSMEKVTLLQGLKNAGLTINDDLSKFYTEYCGVRPPLGFAVHNWTLPEPPASTYPGELIEGAKSFSDKAMIVISRIGGEFADLPHSMTCIDGETESYTENSADYQDFPAGTHYLELSQSEKDMVELVCANFDNVILVYNGANTLELDFVEDYQQIQSVIWCPGPGQTGFNGLGKIIAGQVSPSGKNTDTFVYKLSDTPYFNNIGCFIYQNADELGYESRSAFAAGFTVPHFVNYVENIYVGYKFYETAAAEGLIDYGQTVQYPFGHGLSYTSFTQEMGPISENGGVISFDVTVTNTGSTAGKDVVEVYYNPPYTNGGIEKSSVNLAAFAKTGLLEPGKAETVTISFQAEEMASFDTHGKGCYVLEQGDYTISINADSHTVLDSQTYTVPSDIVYSSGNARVSDAAVATPAFDFAEGKATYLSRRDGFANYADAVAAPADFNMEQESIDTLYTSYNWDPNDYNDPNDPMPLTDQKNGLVLADLRGADYDDPRWEKLLDQMSVAEMDDLIAMGGYATKAEDSIGKVSTTDCDGPSNITNNFTGLASIGFPSACIIASSWDVSLAEAFGRSIGQMGDEMDVTGWYAPAMNLHRSAFDGRNFEYYSEDGVLGGKIAAGSIRGVQEKGLYAYMKHFAMNDQQVSQIEMLCTWSTEQAIREIYLKPFELAVKDGGCRAAMAAWNYIGNQWAGACDSLLNTVLRDEWGFQGMVITDGYHDSGYMDSDRAIRSGCDLMLKNIDVATNHPTDQSSATGLLAMRKACHNILYTVVNSRAYAPENLNPGMAAWQIVLIAMDVVMAAAFLAVEVLIFKNYKKRRQAA